MYQHCTCIIKHNIYYATARMDGRRTDSEKIHDSYTNETYTNLLWDDVAHAMATCAC